ncbi:MAG: FadR/GntR family transcriptional regulator [Arenicella sp.]
MKFQEVKSTSISDTVAEAIQQRIVSGELLAGNKLPPERELAEQFNVSRPSIREAINKLQAKGIVRKVPGGGNYITDEIGASFADPLLELFANDRNASFDILELRFAVEALSAYFAAKRATNAQRENIKLSFEKLLETHNDGVPEKEAKADVAFHMAIAEASNNPAIVHLMRNLLNVLEVSVSSYFHESTENRHVRLPKEHGGIMEAILNKDPILARERMKKHIAGIEKRIAELRYEESHNSEDLLRGENLESISNEMASLLEKENQ